MKLKYFFFLLAPKFENCIIFINIIECYWLGTFFQNRFFTFICTTLHFIYTHNSELVLKMGEESLGGDELIELNEALFRNFGLLHGDGTSLRYPIMLWISSGIFSHQNFMYQENNLKCFQFLRKFDSIFSRFLESSFDCCKLAITSFYSNRIFPIRLMFKFSECVFFCFRNFYFLLFPVLVTLLFSSQLNLKWAFLKYLKTSSHELYRD